MNDSVLDKINDLLFDICCDVVQSNFNIYKEQNYSSKRDILEYEHAEFVLSDYDNICEEVYEKFMENYGGKYGKVALREFEGKEGLIEYLSDEIVPHYDYLELTQLPNEFLNDEQENIEEPDKKTKKSKNKDDFER